jgi:glutamate synthase (NADPH/NADH) large chain/glutamate synthase (ferredoxin)
VVLRTDGGLKTGRDIVLAAILGAEEFNFGTAALIAAGCAMFRICHTNRCPVGVATQDEELRKKYRGKPENVVAFFNGVAQEVRELLAQLGFRTLAEIVGHTDLLERRPLEDFPPEIQRHIESLNLGRWLAKQPRMPFRVAVSERSEQANCGTLNKRIIADAKPALLHQRPVRLDYQVSNEDRSIGTRLSGEVSRVFCGNRLADGMIDITLRGSAGQSFGAFLSRGIRLRLIGEANDYVGKGMGGGEIIIRPPEKSRFEWAKSVLLGNTAMYGATGGRLFAAGLAGERFCVRNSGGIAVVEGVGDHACEYMTGGMVVVLGRTGRNFAAGMSGGIALVFDADNVFTRCCNHETVCAERLTNEDEIAEAKTLILTHQEFTGSARAAEILANWPESVRHFWRVAPRREATESGKVNQGAREILAIAATPA